MSAQRAAESAEPFASWDASDHAAAGIVAEAAGYGRAMPQSDEWLIAWAREYLPRILAHSARGVAAPGEQVAQ